MLLVILFGNVSLPSEFTPLVVLTLGSGGLGDIADAIEQVADPIPYANIPGVKKTTVAVHEGKLLAGYLYGIPVLGLKGRRHFYEEGGEPTTVKTLKNVTFPVYVARALGAEVYFATNAAGGLNPAYNPGDLMIISSHLDLLYPNALAGSQVQFMLPQRFQPQNNQYAQQLRGLLQRAAINVFESRNIHTGVYTCVPGPTYESSADSQALRVLSVDAVGMSTVPEIIVASNLGMETVGFSLISNVIAADGTNKTSHEEVTRALNDPATRARTRDVMREFFRLLPETQLGERFRNSLRSYRMQVWQNKKLHS